MRSSETEHLQAQFDQGSNSTSLWFSWIFPSPCIGLGGIRRASTVASHPDPSIRGGAGAISFSLCFLREVLREGFSEAPQQTFPRAYWLELGYELIPKPIPGKGTRVTFIGWGWRQGPPPATHGPPEVSLFIPPSPGSTVCFLLRVHPSCFTHR